MVILILGILGFVQQLFFCTGNNLNDNSSRYNLFGLWHFKSHFEAVQANTDVPF